jgi:hypothetical protein
MSRREKISALVLALLAFAYGLGMYLALGEEVTRGIEKTIEKTIGTGFLESAGLALGSCLITVTFWYLLARSLAADSRLRVLLTSMLVNCVMAVGIGMLAAVISGIVGLSKLQFHWILAVGALNWILGGLVGFWAVRSSRFT